MRSSSAASRAVVRSCAATANLCAGGKEPRALQRIHPFGERDADRRVGAGDVALRETKHRDPRLGSMAEPMRELERLRGPREIAPTQADFPDLLCAGPRLRDLPNASSAACALSASCSASSSEPCKRMISAR